MEDMDRQKAVALLLCIIMLAAAGCGSILPAEPEEAMATPQILSSSPEPTASPLPSPSPSPSPTPAPTPEATPAEEASPSDAASPSDTPAPTPTPAPTLKPAKGMMGGYTRYENAVANVRFQYPASWVALNAASLADEASRALAQKMVGASDEALTQAFASGQTYFYDPDYEQGGAYPCFTYTVMSAGASTEKNFYQDSTVSQIASQIQSQYSAQYSNVSWIQTPAARSVGDRNFIILRASCTYNDLELELFQAGTLCGKSLYFFTCMIPRGLMTAERLQLLSTMLSNVEFLSETAAN